MEGRKFKKVYIVSDITTAALSWLLFVYYRKAMAEPLTISEPNYLQFGLSTFIGLCGVITYWFIIYYSTGYYSNVMRKLRLEDFSKTFLASFLGSCILFFLVILDDTVHTYKTEYRIFFILFFFQFLLTLIPRMVITSYILKLQEKGMIKFRTLFIGYPNKITQVWKDLNDRYPGHGHDVIGYIPVPTDNLLYEENEFRKLGDFELIHDLVKEKQPEDVIIVLNAEDVTLYDHIIYELNSSNVKVKVNPDLYPVIKGQAIISSLFKYPLIEVSRDLLKPWQASLKQIIDIIGASFGLIVSLPLSLCLAVAIKLTSKGPVFYSHERIGRFGKPFRIVKFRSMYLDAEQNGPQLASSFDSRVTPVGRFMRKLKLDEIPNFYNVLRGEMSLVGPRPERKFYIDQILKRAPEYSRLLKVKPGVTSWGQVKYGYAENVDEMVRRMRYDLLYMENMSLYVDFQILARTILTILKGNSK